MLLPLAAKTLGAKVDDDLRALVLNRCQKKGCRPSDYLKALIKRDLESQVESDKSVADAAAPSKNEGPPQQQEGRSQAPKTKSHIPPYVAKYACRGCGGKLHDNENYQGPAEGKCDSCHEKFIGKSEGKCPFCTHGEVEPLGPEDIEEMGLYSK